MKFFKYSGKGTKRETNEDTLLAVPGKGFFLVADGVGRSHSASEDLSKAFSDLIVNASSKSLRAGAQPLLKEGFERANRILVTRSRDEGVSACSAALAVVISEGFLTAGWVGDCRLYYCSEAKTGFEQLTTDHTRLGELLSRGVIDEDEVAPAMRKSALTRAIGDKDQIQVDFIHRKIGAGDRYLLCTDGVSDHFATSEFAGAVTSMFESHQVWDTSVSFDSLSGFDTLKTAHDDHTLIGIVIDEVDEKGEISTSLIDESIEDASKGLRSEISAIETAQRDERAKKTSQSLKSFFFSLPSRSKKELMIEGAVIAILFGGAFISPGLIAIAGQRLESISVEYFMVLALVLYIITLKLRLRK